MLIIDEHKTNSVSRLCRFQVACSSTICTCTAHGFSPRVHSLITSMKETKSQYTSNVHTRSQCCLYISLSPHFLSTQTQLDMERNTENTHMNSSEEEAVAAFNAMFSNIPVQTLLSLDQDKSLFPLYADNFSFSTSPSPSPMRFAFPNTTTMQHHFTHHPLNRKNFVFTQNFASHQPIDFFTANSSSSSILHCMPPLESLESSSTHHKRPKVESVINNSFYQQHIEGSSSTPSTTAALLPKKANKRSSSKPTLSDKTRALQKLMPWSTKMDISTMLEEAYKYVKYLQAQVKALQSMPVASTICCELNEGVFGGLGRLNRQQLLEVVLNSPAAQTRLYSQGCCVFSIEQLVFLKRMAERKISQQHQQQYQMVFFDASEPS